MHQGRCWMLISLKNVQRQNQVIIKWPWAYMKDYMKQMNFTRCCFFFWGCSTLMGLGFTFVIKWFWICYRICANLWNIWCYIQSTAWRSHHDLMLERDKEHMSRDKLAKIERDDNVVFWLPRVAFPSPLQYSRCKLFIGLCSLKCVSFKTIIGKLMYAIYLQ